MAKNDIQLQTVNTLPKPMMLNTKKYSWGNSDRKPSLKERLKNAATAAGIIGTASTMVGAPLYVAGGGWKHNIPDLGLNKTEVQKKANDDSVKPANNENLKKAKFTYNRNFSTLSDIAENVNYLKDQAADSVKEFVADKVDSAKNAIKVAKFLGKNGVKGAKRIGKKAVENVKKAINKGALSALLYAPIPGSTALYGGIKTVEGAAGAASQQHEKDTDKGHKFRTEIVEKPRKEDFVKVEQNKGDQGIELKAYSNMSKREKATDIIADGVVAGKRAGNILKTAAKNIKKDATDKINRFKERLKGAAIIGGLGIGAAASHPGALDNFPVKSDEMKQYEIAKKENPDLEGNIAEQGLIPWTINKAKNMITTKKFSKVKFKVNKADAEDAEVLNEFNANTPSTEVAPAKKSIFDKISDFAKQAKNKAGEYAGKAKDIADDAAVKLAKTSGNLAKNTVDFVDDVKNKVAKKEQKEFSFFNPAKNSKAAAQYEAEADKLLDELGINNNAERQQIKAEFVKKRMQGEKIGAVIGGILGTVGGFVAGKKATEYGAEKLKLHGSANGKYGTPGEDHADAEYANKYGKYGVGAAGALEKMDWKI